MKTCAVRGCENNSVDQSTKYFFSSPTGKDKDRRQKWAAVSKKNYSEKAQFYICEDHFDMVRDVEYYTLVTRRPVLVATAVPHINIDINQPPITTMLTSIPDSAASSTTSTTFVSSATVLTCTTITVTSSPKFTSSSLTETSTVDSSSGPIATSNLSPQKRKFISSSSSNEPTTTSSEPIEDSKETTGSLYEPGNEAESSDESDSDSECSDLDEFGESVISDSSFTEVESNLVCEFYTATSSAPFHFNFKFKKCIQERCSDDFQNKTLKRQTSHMGYFSVAVFELISVTYVDFSAKF